MSGFGKVISGGKQMTKGLTKGINDKLAGHSKDNDRRAVIATAVKNAYTEKNLSGPSTNNSKNGKFQKATQPTKV